MDNKIRQPITKVTPPVLLWTNETPTSNFDAQTINMTSNIVGS